MQPINIGYVNIHRTDVIANNSTYNNVVFFLVSDLKIVLYFDLLTQPKMPFKVMHLKEVTHSNVSYERKSHGRKLADEMGRAKRIPMVHHRVMHRRE